MSEVFRVTSCCHCRHHRCRKKGGNQGGLENQKVVIHISIEEDIGKLEKLVNGNHVHIFFLKKLKTPFSPFAIFMQVMDRQNGF